MLIVLFAAPGVPVLGDLEIKGQSWTFKKNLPDAGDRAGVLELCSKLQQVGLELEQFVGKESALLGKQAGGRQRGSAWRWRLARRRQQQRAQLPRGTLSDGHGADPRHQWHAGLRCCGGGCEKQGAEHASLGLCFGAPCRPQLVL